MSILDSETVSELLNVWELTTVAGPLKLPSVLSTLTLSLVTEFPVRRFQSTEPAEDLSSCEANASRECSGNH